MSYHVTADFYHVIADLGYPTLVHRSHKVSYTCPSFRGIRARALVV